jgi:hypothetical protein
VSHLHPNRQEGPWTLHVGDDGKAVYVEGWRPQHPDENNVERVEVVPASQLAGAVEAFGQERQAVLDCVNLYGDETLHKALDGIGWPADYLGEHS